MRHWSLRLKLALWSALIVAVASMVLALSAAIHSYSEDVDLIDHVLKAQARDVYAELKRYGHILITQHHREHASELPAAWRAEYVEIARGGRVLYRSKKLKDMTLATGPQPSGSYSIIHTGRTFRVLVVAEKGWEVRTAVPLLEPLDSALELGRGALVAVPFMLLITGFGGWWVSRRALAPVEAIAAAAERITASHLDQRLPVPIARDEIQHLTLVLNRMIERLEISLRQASRFSADASHELRTPLTVIRVALEDALSAGHLPPAEQEKLLLDLLDEATQLSDISTKLLLLSRADAGRLSLDLETFDFARLVAEAVEEAAMFGEASAVDIQTELPMEVSLAADRSRLLQVLRNLLENAVKYNRPGGKVKVELAVETSALHLRVFNTGHVIAPQDAPHLFERFYRVEEHRQSRGHGLGLSIAREIARAHGGELSFAGSTPEWTVFELQLPLAPARAPALATESA